MFRQLLKALIFLLVACVAQRHLEENLCENGKSVYSIYAIDGTIPNEKKDCTYSFTIQSGECVLLVHNIKANEDGNVCLNAASSHCDEFNPSIMTGSISAECAGTAEHEAFPVIENFEFNKEIPIDTKILKVNIAVGHGCEGEVPVEIWKPNECVVEEKKDTEENKETKKKDDLESVEPTEPAKPEKNEADNKEPTEQDQKEPEKKEPEKKETNEKNETDEKKNTEPEKKQTEPAKEEDKNKEDNKENPKKDDTKKEDGNKDKTAAEVSFSLKTGVSMFIFLSALFLI